MGTCLRTHVCMHAPIKSMHVCKYVCLYVLFTYLCAGKMIHILHRAAALKDPTTQIHKHLPTPQLQFPKMETRIAFCLGTLDPYPGAPNSPNYVLFTYFSPQARYFSHGAAGLGFVGDANVASPLLTAPPPELVDKGHTVQLGLESFQELEGSLQGSRK